MQVKELIEQLQDMNPEAEVHFAYGYGDHWRTEVAPKVDRVDMGAVVFSEYHRMDKMVEMDDENCYDEESGEERVDETLRRVVVLS
jgi:tRNA/tmRNA/rRNA uracil-C5-methylase (TrmA/RlmC/RlmD family)